MFSWLKKNRSIVLDIINVAGIAASFGLFGPAGGAIATAVGIAGRAAKQLLPPAEAGPGQVADAEEPKKL